MAVPASVRGAEARLYEKRAEMVQNVQNGQARKDEWINTCDIQAVNYSVMEEL